MYPSCGPSPPSQSNIIMFCFVVFFSRFRNKETSRDEFIFYSKRLMRLLIERALSFLPSQVPDAQSFGFFLNKIYVETGIKRVKQKLYKYKKIGIKWNKLK